MVTVFGHSALHSSEEKAIAVLDSRMHETPSRRYTAIWVTLIYALWALYLAAKVDTADAVRPPLHHSMVERTHLDYIAHNCDVFVV